jgi:hypothetical protein
MCLLGDVSGLEYDGVDASDSACVCQSLDYRAIRRMRAECTERQIYIREYAGRETVAASAFCDDQINGWCIIQSKICCDHPYSMSRYS